MKKYSEFKARYLNPLTDFGFHKIFGTEANKGLLIDFLNEVIKGEGHITEIEYLRSEQWGFVETNRKAVFDIFCKTKNGESFIVEMQKAKQAYFRDRSIFYASCPRFGEIVIRRSLPCEFDKISFDSRREFARNKRKKHDSFQGLSFNARNYFHHSFFARGRYFSCLRDVVNNNP